MEKPKETDEPKPDLGGAAGLSLSPQAARHLAQVESEATLLTTIAPDARRTRLHEIIAGATPYSAEALVRLCRFAHERRDRRLMNLAAAALVKVATPLLLSQARALGPEDREDQVQSIFTQLIGDIRTGRSAHAERFFAAYTKRRSISLYRKRRATMEGTHQRLEPAENVDPLDHVASPVPSHEARVWVAEAIKKLPSKLKAPFIQYHRLGLTQEEIAAHHRVDVRTVRNWLKEAAIAVGLKGDDHD